MPVAPFRPAAVVNAARRELEGAGSPSYVVAVIGADGGIDLAPIVFAQRQKAHDHARALRPGEGETIVVVGREAAGRRALFGVYDAGMRKLHEHLEVIERTLLEDGSVGLV